MLFGSTVFAKFPRFMKWLKVSGLIFVGGVLLLAVAPLFISLNDYVLLIEREVSGTLREPVKVTGLRAGGLPLPHVTVDGISIGQHGDVTAAHVTITPDLWSLFGSKKVIRSIHIDQLVITQRALKKIPSWTRPRTGSSNMANSMDVTVARIEIDSALLTLKHIVFGPFDGRLTLTDNNRLDAAWIVTRDRKLRATIRPEGSRYRVEAHARDWTLPVKAAAVHFDELIIDGVATSLDLNLRSVQARTYGGTFNGHATLSWKKGVRLKGNAKLGGVEVSSLSRAFGRPPKLSGRLNAKPFFYANATKGAELLKVLHLETPFDIQNGVLQGVDIEKSATSIFRNKDPSAHTRFDELAGHLVLDRRTRRFTRLRVTAGSVSARGSVTVSPDDELSGRINTNIEGKLASASMPLNVSGTVNSPVVLPPGSIAAGAAVGTAILGPAGTALGTALGVKLEQLFGGESAQ